MTIYWFLPAIILLGVVTAYTDLREGKIKNKHILMALAYSLIVHFILIYLNLGTIRTGYFIELIISSFLSLFTGFVIWYVGLWTAGDAKLFFAYSVLLPLSVYRYGYVPYFPSTSILINTFVPIFLFLLVILLLKTSFKQKWSFLKQSFTPKKILNLTVFLFAFTWLIGIMFRLVKIPPNYFLTIFLLFLLMTFLEKLTPFNLFQIILGVGVLRLILDTSVYSIPFLKEFLVLLLTFIILRFFVINLGFSFFTKEVDIDLLKKGMIPAEVVYKKKSGYEKQDIAFFSMFDYLSEKMKKREYLIEPASEGLTEENVEKLKNLKNQLGFEHLRIQQMIPFAPFMFLGTILTVVAEGDIFVALRLLLLA